MRWRLALLVSALVVVPLVLLLASGFGHDPHALPSTLEGRPAPEFTLQPVDGSPAISLAALRGRPVVINFWATWCVPCQAEHELLQEAAQIYGDRVQLLGIVYEDSLPQVQRYLQRHGNSFPQLLDPDSRAAIDFGVAGVPESFVVDAAGQLVHKEAGMLSVAILQQVVTPLARLVPTKMLPAAPLQPATVAPAPAAADAVLPAAAGSSGSTQGY